MAAPAPAAAPQTGAPAGTNPRRALRRVFAVSLCGAAQGVAGQTVALPPATPQTVADIPMGCFNFGYQYAPEMKNVTGQPFSTASSLLCQQRCASTPGCKRFGFWTQGLQCWLGGAESVAMISQTLGAISGPADCGQEEAACTAIPGPGFPGATAAESRLAWPTLQQPTNLQCWPRKANGFPGTCENQTATVLQDTLNGWPGRCEGLMKIDNLAAGETCQKRCFMSPLCGVWASENISASDGSLTCWQGMFGTNCYDSSNGLSPPPGAYFRAQRVMHGTFRVLMNTASIHIQNLTNAFGIKMHANWTEGAKACRMTCLSYVLCQYWQYSDVYGCFVEDDMTKSVGYPLVNDGVMLSTSSYTAQTIKAGEYIQHTCKPGPKQPLPLDPPYILTPGDTAVAKPKDKTNIPKYGQAQQMAQSRNMPARPPRARIDVSEEPPRPIWATMLILVTIALCLGVIGAAGWMTFLDADKMGSRKNNFADVFNHIPGMGGGGAGLGGSRSSSFDAQGQPLTGGGAPHGHWGFGQTYHNLPFGGGGHYGHHMPQPGGYGQPPTRDQLMQYAHGGY